MQGAWSEEAGTDATKGCFAIMKFGFISPG